MMERWYVSLVARGFNAREHAEHCQQLEGTNYMTLAMGQLLLVGLHLFGCRLVLRRCTTRYFFGSPFEQD
jgi:hypothetical protein